MHSWFFFSFFFFLFFFFFFLFWWFLAYNFYFMWVFPSFLLGERTFGVLTKLDLMDKGTNALDVRILSNVFSFKFLEI